LQDAIQRLDQQQLASADGTAQLTRDINSLGRNTNKRLARSDDRTKRQFTIARQEADARHSKTDATLKNQYDAWKRDRDIQKVLGSLHFPQMTERQSNIHDATPGTVEWIFLSQLEFDKRNRSLDWSPYYWFRPTWDNFGEWLRSPDSTFWICGKLGSGKSTLMASLMGIYRGKVKEALQDWSATSQVHLFSYFFWRPGSELQKSTSGLLRSLLYQVFQAEQDNILSVIFKMSIDIPNLPLWNERTLSQVLVAALSTLRVPCCIFIDGLDEFLGDYDHLLDVISNLQHLKNVKICVSSRPEVQLRNRLDDCKQLRLQDLNYHDISVFVKQRLDRVASRLQGIDQSKNFHHLIAYEADGVFLWAVLVTQALIDGASTADDADTLRKRIKMMPRHIEGLFLNMLGAIDELHKESLAFYIKILLTFPYKPTPLEVSPLISIAVITAARAEGAVIWDKSFVDLCKDTEAQIIGHSAGMIEIRQRRFADYLDEEEWHSSGEWFIIKDFDDAVEKSSPCKSCIRNESAETTQPLPLVFKYEANYPSWVHRSAYDFINNPANLEKSGLSMMSTQECYRRVFRAATLYMRSAPSIVALAEDRLRDILRVLDFHWVVEPSLIMELTSEVHNTVLHMSHEEFTNSIGFEGELALHYKFWTLCEGSLFYEYGLSQVSTIPLALLTLCLRYSCYESRSFGHNLAWKLSKRIIWLASYLQPMPFDLSTSVRVIENVDHVNNFMISYNLLAKMKSLRTMS
jgi:ABC-type oligopeptide transport system ATPase subunit